MFRILTLLILLSGCSPPLVPIPKVNDCNEQKKECNDKAHQEECGGQSGRSCVEKIIKNENWDSSAFESKIKQCDADYSQCLNRYSEPRK